MITATIKKVTTSLKNNPLKFYYREFSKSKISSIMFELAFVFVFYKRSSLRISILKQTK